MRSCLGACLRLLYVQMKFLLYIGNPRILCDPNLFSDLIIHSPNPQMGRKLRNQQFVRQRYNPASFQVAPPDSAPPVIPSGLPSTFSEGPAIREEHEVTAESTFSAPGSAASSSHDVRRHTYTEPAPYARGNKKEAVRIASSTVEREAAKSELVKDAYASSAISPFESRRATWEEVGQAAGFSCPFSLTVDSVYTITGILRKAQYRSAEQYLDTAVQIFIERHGVVTPALRQAIKRATRAAKRNRGPAKQAQGLPLRSCGSLPAVEKPAVSQGPCRPACAVRLTSWWLLRELEASSAKLKHVTVDSQSKVVRWRLPNSKTDLAALGATRSHSCCCQSARDPICPYCDMVDQIAWVRSSFPSLGEDAPVFPSVSGSPPSKQGFADTYQWAGKQLGVPVVGPTGLRLFTGHSGRATGAQYLAGLGVELWRIQLFGRWGSDAFVLYVRDAPLFLICTALPRKRHFLLLWPPQSPSWPVS